MTKTIPLREVYSKYQPIVKSTSKWELNTLVTVILRRYATATGKVTYLVKFRDGSTSKVSARSLYKRNADLIEIFEHKRLLALESPDEDDDDAPLKRTHPDNQSPSPKKAKRKLVNKSKSATSSPHIPSSLRSSSLSPPDTIRLVLTHLPIYSSECYHCSKGETPIPLASCRSCTFSFHPSCNDNETTCLLCRTHGSDCMHCKTRIEALMVRCKECSRAMHRSCMHRDVCGDCHRDEMIEKCLGERNDEILVKWRNESYGCIEWVPMTWIQFKYPEVYKDYLTSDRCHSVDKEEFSVERVLDVIWHDRRQPNHVKLLYKNMKQEEAVWEAPPTENQAYEEALEIYKKNHMNTEAQ